MSAETETVLCEPTAFYVTLFNSNVLSVCLVSYERIEMIDFRFRLNGDRFYTACDHQSRHFKLISNIIFIDSFEWSRS